LTVTPNRRWGGSPNSGLRQSAPTPSSVEVKIRTSSSAIGVSGVSSSPQRSMPVSSYSCVALIPMLAAWRLRASADAATGISTRHSFSGASTRTWPRSMRGAIR
jgi:hypothetical protein